MSNMDELAAPIIDHAKTVSVKAGIDTKEAHDAYRVTHNA